MTASEDHPTNPATPPSGSGREGITGTYPLLPLRDVVVFPYMVVPLFVGRKKSIRSIEEAMMKDRKIILCAQKNPKTDDPSVDDLYMTGTVAEILQLLKLPDGILKILVEGTTRVKIDRFLKEDECFEVDVSEVMIADEKTVELQALMRNVISLFEQYVKLNKKIPLEVIMVANNVEEPGRLADIITAHLTLKVEEKQEILEAFEPRARLEKIATILNRELEIMMVEKKIRGQVRKQMEQIQKEYYLREQMKAIQKELGEGEDRGDELEELKEAIAKAKMPEDARTKADKELNKLMKMPPGSAEATVSRNYIDWLVSLPWAKQSKDRIDIEKCENILNEDHFGLKKVKERIIEYLAVCKLKKSIKGPILCLIGPPGVGKTSLGRSIARSLNRKFARISLGGMRDEAEIRGHRRTYIGALPGRIIQALRDTGTRNPVILLDEIDKMGMDFRGDPSSALLEVLDPEQNYTFSDHFIATPFDLSKVLFLTTANVPHTIPPALKDRLEIVYLPGYTEEEKVQIAKKYLVPKQLESNGIDKYEVKVEDSAIIDVIRKYTRESGVRSLERELAAIGRKVARNIIFKLQKANIKAADNDDKEEREAAAEVAAEPKNARESKEPKEPKESKEKPAAEGKTPKLTEAEVAARDAIGQIVVSAENVEAYLGVPTFHLDKKEERDEIGVVTGLAWTEVGGTILPIEVAVMPGRGKIILTGSLGNVMKESVHAGISYLRSHAEELRMRPIDYDKIDLHVHFPEGGIPKDGPSAGIAIATAIYSALNEVPVSSDVAMTGEITLRGKVLPVGGIKEKLLAAHRHNIHNIILSVENEKDLTEIPEEIRKVMNITRVKSASEVLALALKGEPKKTPLEFPGYPFGEKAGKKKRLKDLGREKREIASKTHRKRSTRV
ncbi:MAG TPA: endopeptidase La [Candidatus Ozemobacteraceae bacterium]|nr:endopeptidase La [Candidatus Ozemobacteraceae bacterium]